MKEKTRPTTIDAYIAMYPVSTQNILQKMRTVIKKAAPQATEAIVYGIPTFILHGNLVHFGAFKTHVGFYPGPSGIAAFATELSKHTLSKGSVQFLYSEHIPYTLITKIVRYRVRENLNT